jgi:hypothetical protein
VARASFAASMGLPVLGIMRSYTGLLSWLFSQISPLLSIKWNHSWILLNVNILTYVVSNCYALLHAVMLSNVMEYSVIWLLLSSYLPFASLSLQRNSTFMPSFFSLFYSFFFFLFFRSTCTSYPFLLSQQSYSSTVFKLSSLTSPHTNTYTHIHTLIVSRIWNMALFPSMSLHHLHINLLSLFPSSSLISSSTHQSPLFVSFI